MKRIILTIALAIATIMAQAQTYRIESAFSDEVQALVIDSKAPVHLLCNAPEGQQTLALTTPDAAYQFNPVAAVRDSLLTIDYPLEEGSILLRLSHLPSVITVRTGSSLTIDSLDNYTAYSQNARACFWVDDSAELRVLPHLNLYVCFLDAAPFSHVDFEQGIDISWGALNIQNDAQVNYHYDLSRLPGRVPIVNDPGFRADRERNGGPTFRKRSRSQDTDLILNTVFGLTTGVHNHAAYLSPYRLGTGLRMDINLYWIAHWDPHYYDEYNPSQRSKNPNDRHATAIGLGYGSEWMPFSNQTLLAGGEMGFSPEPTALVLSRQVFANHYLQLPMRYCFSNARKTGFTVGLYPGINLRGKQVWDWQSDGFSGASSPIGSLSVVNRYRLDASFFFALRGVRFPEIRYGILPTFTTPDGRGVHTMTLTWQF